jgi:hypothetical protein
MYTFPYTLAATVAAGVGLTLSTIYEYQRPYPILFGRPTAVTGVDVNPRVSNNLIETVIAGVIEAARTTGIDPVVETVVEPPSEPGSSCWGLDQEGL